MSVYSVNQVRNLYVANACKTAVSDGKLVQTDLANVGDLQVKTDVDGNLFFAYDGAGGITRSDLITNISYAKATPASKLNYVLKKAEVALKGAIDVTKTYVLRVNIKQFVGMSDEETHLIYASCKPDAEGVTDAEGLYKALVDNLNANLSKEQVPLFTVESAATGITITEVEQEWTRGIKPLVPVYFEVFLVNDLGNAGTVTYGDSDKSIKDGKEIADLEYFCMGERGDVYRNINWPNSIPTEYLVDPTKEYQVLDIHFQFVGGGENPQKSEKDITIVAETAAILNSIIEAVNAATGLSIATL